MYREVFMKKSYQITANIMTGITFVLCGLLAVLMLTGRTNGSAFEIPYVCGLGLHFQTDGFRALYGTIAAFMQFR